MRSTKTMKSKSFTYKLGDHRRIPRSRVWLEGKRLSAHGFTAGRRYKRTATIGTIVLTADNDGSLAVSGYDHRPIIDMSGELIARAFFGHAKVTATYTENMIVITGGAA